MAFKILSFPFTRLSIINKYNRSLKESHSLSLYASGWSILMRNKLFLSLKKQLFPPDFLPWPKLMPHEPYFSWYIQHTSTTFSYSGEDQHHCVVSLGLPGLCACCCCCKSDVSSGELSISLVGYYYLYMTECKAEHCDWLKCSHRKTHPTFSINDNSCAVLIVDKPKESHIWLVLSVWVTQYIAEAL